MNKEITYYSSGIVLGNYWGGGGGSYNATKYKSKSKEDLIEQNNKALLSGNLDSGMGFESLIGALLIIETKTELIIEEKTYTNSEYEEIFIGDMNEQQCDFLEMIYNDYE